MRIIPKNMQKFDKLGGEKGDGKSKRFRKIVMATKN